MSNIPVWQQTVLDTFENMTGDKPGGMHAPDPGAAPAPDTKDDYDKSMKDMVDSALQDMYNDDGASGLPNQKAVERSDAVLEEKQDTDEPGVLESLAYGVVKGKEELTFSNNFNDYMITKHPDIALELGLNQRGNVRKNNKYTKDNAVVEAIRGVINTSPAFFPLRTVGKVVKEVAETVAGEDLVPRGKQDVGLSLNNITDSVIEKTMARVFATQEEVEKMEQTWIREQFGPEWFDKTEVERRQMIEADTDHLLKSAFPDVYGTEAADGVASNVGQFAGALLDPTTLIPAAGSMKAAIATGAVIGVSDASMYDLAKQGKIDPAHVVMGGTLGAFLGPGIKYVGGKFGKFVGSKINMKKANKLLDKYEKIVLEQRGKGVSRDFAHTKAKEYWGFRSEDIKDLYALTGRSFDDKITPVAAREALESRLSWFARNRLVQKTADIVDPIIRPVSERIAKYSPKLAHNLRAHDAATHIRTHMWLEKVNPFFRTMKKMSGKDQKLIKRHLMNSDINEFRKIVDKYAKNDPKRFGNIMAEYREMRRVTHEVHKLYKSMGYDIDFIKHYFPRMWKDPKRMGDVQKGLFNQRASEMSRKLGRPLNSSEVKDLVKRLIVADEVKPVKAKVSGSLKERKIDKINAYLEDFYADPLESMHSYLRMAAHDIERARFFKKFGYKGKLLTDGTDLDARLDDVLTKEIKRLGWDKGGKEADEVLSMLKDRFGTGENSPSRFIQNAKNLGYMTTLGNPLSALTQLGDQAFAMYKNGVVETARATVRGLARKRVITKADLGLADAIEELYSSTSKLKVGLNKMLKWSQFNRMDKFGKENIMNGALNKYRKMVKTPKGQQQFAAKYGEYFEAEMPALVRDLKKGVLSDNVKLLMWHELADVQPIALSEMPQKYLNSPNGRIFYMLKTFTIKQVDFMRREIVREFARGNNALAAKNLAAFTGFWLMANGIADASKEGLVSLLTGDYEFDIADNAVENMLQLMVWSRYMNYQVATGGPLRAALDFLAPPTNIDNLFVGAATGDYAKAAEPIPIVGKIISKAAREQKKKTRTRRGMSRGRE